MSELRQDPISQRWVVIAQNRSQRPDEFKTTPPIRNDVSCPFCAGHETETPQPIAVYPPGINPTHPDWQVRVVPNKYPAISDQAQTSPSTGSSEGSPFFQTQPGIGVHEVIIESPQHVSSLSQLTDLQAHYTFTAFRDRLKTLSANPHLAHALVFKNSGPAAGSSLEHVHSQLLATPIIPPVIEQELASSATFHKQHGHCIFCVMLEKEIAAKARIVEQTKNFVAFCPFASRFPFEVWILPLRHLSNFENEQTDQIEEVSILTRNIIGQIEKLLGQPAYNFFIHSAPFDTPASLYYHWHIELFPRLTVAAGYEWGSGSFINPVSPEQSAEKMRNLPE